MLGTAPGQRPQGLLRLPQQGASLIWGLPWDRSWASPLRGAPPPGRGWAPRSAPPSRCPGNRRHETVLRCFHPFQTPELEERTPSPLFSPSPVSTGVSVQPLPSRISLLNRINHRFYPSYRATRHANPADPVRLWSVLPGQTSADMRTSEPRFRFRLSCCFSISFYELWRFFKSGGGRRPAFLEEGAQQASDTRLSAGAAFRSLFLCRRPVRNRHRDIYIC